MKRIVALVGVALVGLLAHPTGAGAAEPFDREIASMLVAPTDPSLVEVLDPAVNPHSGPVTEAQVKAVGHGTPGEVAMVRGGYTRTYRSGAQVLTEFGIDGGAIGDAQRRLDDGLDVGGTPLTVPGATGFALTEGLTPDGLAYAVVGFEAGPRSFSVGVTGADPDHALLYAQMNAVAAAAVAVPTDVALPATTVGGGSGPRTATATAGPATGLAAHWSEVVHDERIDLFLGGAAILLALVLLNRAVNARRRRPVRTTTGHRAAGRPGQAAWAPNATTWPTLGHDRWPSSDEAAFPTVAPLGSAPSTRRAADLPIEAYTGERSIGWGDEVDDEPAAAAQMAAPGSDPLPPLPSRSKTPRATAPATALLPTTGPTATPAIVPVPAPAAETASARTVSAPLHEEEQYSFPGAETWPGDPVGDGRA